MVCRFVVNILWIGPYDPGFRSSSGTRSTVHRVNPEPADQISGPDRPRTGRRLAVAGVVGTALALGGVAVAQAASAPSPSTSAPAPSASGSAAPGDKTPGDKAPEERERTPHLAGTVVSASGGTIVITDRQGFQRTIKTTGDTEYADGLTATPAAGTTLHAEGTVDADKTSLVATRIGKLPERAGRGGPGGFPGRGHGGGPGRGGPDRDADPTPPAGSATPAPGTPAPGTPAPATPSPATPSPTETTPTPAPTS